MLNRIIVNKNNLLRITVALLIGAGCVLIYPNLNAKEEIHEVLRAIQGFGIWQVPAYIAFYSIGSVFFVPLSILTLGAGVLFQEPLSMLIAWLAANLAACVTFLGARYLARNWISKSFKEHPHFQSLDQAVSESGWKAVFFLRLIPFMPYPVVNAALGLSGITFKQYMAGSMLGAVPFTVAFAGIGSLAKDVSQIGEKSPELATGEIVFVIIGVIAAVSFMWQIRRVFRKKIELGVEGDR